MKKLICYYGDSPVHVEGFSKDCARSCEGSLHILPRKHKTVTDGEYQHILEKYSWMKSKLKVISEIGKTDPRNKVKEDSSEKVKPDVEEDTKPSQGDTGKKKKVTKKKSSNKKKSKKRS